MNDAEVCCSPMHLFLLTARAAPGLWQLCCCKGDLDKTKGLKSNAPRLCITSLHSSPPCAGKCFALPLGRAALTPKRAGSQGGSPAWLQEPPPPQGLSPSSGALSWGLLLVGSQCAGTGIIGIRNCVLQGKRKKMENKGSIIMTVRGDGGINHCKQGLLWGKGRVSEQSWAAFACQVLTEKSGWCVLPRHCW